MRLSRKRWRILRMKRIARKMFRCTWYTVNGAMAMVFLLSILTLDSPSWWPTITMCASGLWLVFAAWVNEWLYAGDVVQEDEHP